MNYRIEKDLLGERKIPNTLYYGIHTLRAMENFPLTSYKIDPAFIKSFGLVKKACILTNAELGYLKKTLVSPLVTAVEELIENKLDDHIVVDPLQGGAGTSTNMNINEVIANRALETAGRKKGDYEYIHPINHVNLHQSTNDVYPTAMKTAALMLLIDAETAIAELQNAFQEKEKEFAHILKTGRTQLQDAVPLTLGRTFSAFADAVARDRWRIFKCRERLRVVNLGGTMIGTGITAPRDYIFTAADTLRNITGLNISRGENLIDATQNNDPFVEVSGILKAHAVNLRKIANDLRLLSSGPKTGIGEIRLFPLQAGSSIMPGKVNPVIAEMIEQCAVKIFANDLIITETASRGELELNAFLPLLNFALMESLRLCINGNNIFREKCISRIKADETQCRRNVNNSLGFLTGLLPKLGYGKVQEIAEQSYKTGKTPSDIIIENQIMTAGEVKKLVTPENFSKLGFDPEEYEDMDKKC
ncbi:aspartate ammonia-lyase [bacterium]|nr:aspartate ammonia-lyase [bacterium]